MSLDLLPNSFLTDLIIQFCEEHCDEEFADASKTAVSVSSYDNVDEVEDGPREKAGALLLSTAAGKTGAEELANVGIDSSCTYILSNRNSFMLNPRMTELAAGIVANLAVHRTTREALRTNASLLDAAETCFVESLDPQTLSELIRFFAMIALVSPPEECSKIVRQADETGSDLNSTNISHSRISSSNSRLLVSQTIGRGYLLPKACWVLFNSLDAVLLSRTAEFLNHLSFFDPVLFRLTAKRRDLQLAEATAALIVEHWDDTLVQAADPKTSARALDLLAALSELEEDAGEWTDSGGGDRNDDERGVGGGGGGGEGGHEQSTDLKKKKALDETIVGDVEELGLRSIASVMAVLERTKPKLEQIRANRECEHSKSVVSCALLIMENLSDFNCQKRQSLKVAKDQLFLGPSCSGFTS